MRANGAAIKVVRNRSGLSLRDLAEASGVSIATLSRIESGESPGRPKTLKAIADGLGVSVLVIATVEVAA